jgi:hypothetical protein
MRPLARSLGLQIEDEPLLSETTYPGHEEAATELLRHLGYPHEATVASSQGPVIADLVSRLAEDDDVDLPSPPGAEKGGVWALTFRDERLADAEYFAAPRPDACH